MPFREDVELFCRAVGENARIEADKILSQAQLEAEGVITAARRLAESEFQEKITVQRGKACLEAKRLLDAAELEAKKRINTFREQVIQEIISALKLRLQKIRNQIQYRDFLLSSIDEGIKALPGNVFQVELNPADVGFVLEKLETISRQGVLKIEASAMPELEGGARIYTGDKRLLFDNSLRARLKRCEDEIRREIWNTLFGGGKSDT